MKKRPTMAHLKKNFKGQRHDGFLFDRMISLHLIFLPFLVLEIKY